MNNQHCCPPRDHELALRDERRGRLRRRIRLEKFPPLQPPETYNLTGIQGDWRHKTSMISKSGRL